MKAATKARRIERLQAILMRIQQEYPQIACELDHPIAFLGEQVRELLLMNPNANVGRMGKMLGAKMSDVAKSQKTTDFGKNEVFPTPLLRRKNFPPHIG